MGPQSSSFHLAGTVAPETFVFDCNTPVDPSLQMRVEKIDAHLRAKYGMTTDAVGLLDLDHPRLAISHLDSCFVAPFQKPIAQIRGFFDRLPPPMHPNAHSAKILRRLRRSE